MRKSLLLAALGWAMPMYMSDVAAAAAPVPIGENSTDNAGISAVPVPDADHTPEQRAAALEAMGNAAGGASSAEQKPEVASVSAAPAGANAGEAGNAGASSDLAAASPSSSPATATAEVGGEAPNVASDAVEPSLSAAASATNADGAATSSPIVASSGAELPLHLRVARHLEAIFQLTKTEVEAPARSISAEAVELKAHIYETLHKLRNGISVAEGELVQKLEAILRLL